MKRLLALSLSAVLSLTAGLTAAGAEGYEKQKVVYHINFDSEYHLKMALRNIQNHVSAVGKENLDLRVVMHGKGLALLMMANDYTDVQNTVIKLKQENVRFNVCNITLIESKIDYKNDLFDVSDEDIVPSGVAEIARLQKNGYSYVKP